MTAKPAHITDALDRLRTALTDKVASATLYGSYVRGDFRADASDINLAVVVRGSDLSALVAPLREAWRAARIDPWIARADELPGLSDVFATRVRDIQRRHEMLIGDDPWTALVIPRAALRLRVEQELRNHQMRLRHAEVLTDTAGRSRQLHICAGALRLDLALLEELAGGTAHEEIDALAEAASKRLDVPRGDIVSVLEYRAKHGGELAVLLAATTRLLDRAVAVVDTMEVL
jgi:hypothetical protein